MKSFSEQLSFSYSSIFTLDWFSLQGFQLNFLLHLSSNPSEMHGPPMSTSYDQPNNMWRRARITKLPYVLSLISCNFLFFFYFQVLSVFCCRTAPVSSFVWNENTYCDIWAFSITNLAVAKHTTVQVTRLPL
jgi:hypothetical protein